MCWTHLLQKILRPVKVLLLEWWQRGAGAGAGAGGSLREAEQDEVEMEEATQVEVKVPSPPPSCCSSSGCCSMTCSQAGLV